MKTFSLRFLVCLAFTSCTTLESTQAQVQKVTVRHEVPDFLTEAPPSTTDSPEPIVDHSVPLPNLRPVKELEDEERFKNLQGKESAEFWKNVAQSELRSRETSKPIERIAKNVIYFVGDGMSVTTVAGARILKGQKNKDYRFGEEAQLHMDTFPYLGASRTFCSDAQVADSACSATALFSGSKTNFKTIGVTPDVLVGDCKAQMKPENQLSSILAWAQKAGKSTGIVTTTRITHATPAGTYAHTAHRDWENDGEVTKSGIYSDECDDIAEQLVLKEPGKNINVIMGGGRKHLLPSTFTDSEYGLNGVRNDSKNLIEMWKRQNKDRKSTYVDNVEDLLQVDTNEIDYLMGLFSYDHVEYSDNLTVNHDPTLRNMTNVAIKILSKNPNGFFLMVEGGRIDHALHENFGQRALLETIEMDEAIKLADELTNDDDTLIAVTADHSHVMSLAGYPIRGNSILGVAEISDLDNLPYTTISFANGPGFRNHTEGFRANVSHDKLDKIDYRQHTGVPLKYETHGGEDVFIFSKGPYAHYLTGVNLQNYIPFVMGYAACIGPPGAAQSPLCNEVHPHGDHDHVHARAGAARETLASLSFLNLVLLLLLANVVAQRRMQNVMA